MVTLFFRKTREVERRIATPGKALERIRVVWGNGPIGRWMRVLHVYAFFLYRNVPRVGSRIAARMGDENEPLPLSLKLWVIVPFTVYAILMFLFFSQAGISEHLTSVLHQRAIIRADLSVRA